MGDRHDCDADKGFDDLLGYGPGAVHAPLRLSADRPRNPPALRRVGGRLGVATHVALTLALAGCAADSAPAESPRYLPTDDVLCRVWAGHDPMNRQEFRTFGTYADDVSSPDVWGDPTSKAGKVWTYRWCVDSACTKVATVAVEFEQADLCNAAGKPAASGLFVAEIRVEGTEFRKCWDPFIYNEKGTCRDCDVDTTTLGVCRG